MNNINWKNIREGLEKYQSIMDQYKNSKSISSSDEFQKLFRSFYGMNRAGMSASCYKEYFCLLDEARVNNNFEFKFVLKSLFEKSGKKHFSFTSKLLATANPNLPVWDSKVRRYLNFKFNLKFKNSFRDIDSCEHEYDRYCSWFKDFLKSDEATTLIHEFDKNMPNVKITKMKKVDLMFWQMEY